jgi:hypothetical protein
MADNKPEAPEVVAQEAKTVGDENMTPREREFEVVSESVQAQVPGKPEDPASTVKVHEVYVTTDTVITDTSDPLAVQIPDAGRGDLNLPIHALDAPTVEEVFASKAAKVEERDGDVPTASDPNPAAHEDE